MELWQRRIILPEKHAAGGIHEGLYSIAKVLVKSDMNSTGEIPQPRRINYCNETPEFSILNYPIK
jgi:hypothetical protein